MAVFHTTGPSGPSDVAISSKSTPVTESITVVTAGTEVTWNIPVGTKAFAMKAANNAYFMIATTALGTGSDTTSHKFWPGEEWNEELLAGESAIDVYVTASKNNTVLQILRWT